MFVTVTWGEFTYFAPVLTRPGTCWKKHSRLDKKLVKNYVWHEIFFFLGQLSQKEGEISTAEENYTKALDTFGSFKFPENKLYVKEVVSTLQEIGIKPEIRKRKAEDLVGRPDQPPRQAIKC